MRQIFSMIILAWFLTAFTSFSQPSQARQSLFDGKSLQGWTRIGDANWHVTGNAIMADQSTQRSFLLSKQSYDDFRLRVEFRPGPDTNSGIYIRCGDRENLTPTSCYEINIADRHPNENFRTGSIVKFTALDRMVNTEDKWNTFEITAKGSVITVNLNGMLVAHMSNATLSNGAIALQYGEGKIQFREVEIETLPKDD